MTWNNLKEIMFLTLLACHMMFFHVLGHMVLLKYLVTVKVSLENCGKKTVLKMNWTGRLFIQRKAFVLYRRSQQYKHRSCQELKFRCHCRKRWPKPIVWVKVRKVESDSLHLLFALRITIYRFHWWKGLHFEICLVFCKFGCKWNWSECRQCLK